MPHRLATVLASLLTLAPLSAQADRYELGLRLRAFERHLAVADPARRDPAFLQMQGAVQAFFRLDTAAVARAIAAADAALAGAAPTPAVRFADSLQLAFAARLLPTGGSVPFTLGRTWRSDEEQPEHLQLRLSAKGMPAAVELPVRELPLQGLLSLAGMAAGEHEVRWQLRAGDQVLIERSAFLSIAGNAGARLAALASAAKAVTGRDLEARTLVALQQQLQGMTRSRAEETVLPGARLLDEAERLGKAVAEGKPYYGSERQGQFWLRLPTASSTFAVRLLVPKPAAGKQPLVLALHGAGGSENLFFDGYGDGEIVRQCEQRSFYLCAPRAGLGTPDLPALIDALAARYPIDVHKVLLVGHSMGAAMAVAAASAAPARFLAVAPLGGGGNVQEGAGLRQLPFFVATGTRDFLRAGAERLHVRLQQLQVPCDWREYEGVEHLCVVQIALPDVFALFDRLLAR